MSEEIVQPHVAFALVMYLSKGQIIMSEEIEQPHVAFAVVMYLSKGHKLIQEMEYLTS